MGTLWFNNETRRGIILHYDGFNWKQVYLANFNSYFFKVREDTYGKCFIGCIKQDVHYNTNDTTAFFEFDGKNLIQIYTDENSKIKQGWLSIVGGIAFYSLENVIYKYNNKQLIELFKTCSQYFSPSIFGRNEKDIFLGTSKGIEHYDGTDIQLLTEFGILINDGLMFENEVVFLNSIAIDKVSLIYHGKLK